MPLISCIVNVDSRPENAETKQMFQGCVDRDYLTAGLENKRKWLEGFDFELICFLDEHEPVDEKTLAAMRELCDTLIIRKHNKKFEEDENCTFFNDLNYLAALSQARGKYIVHCDGDVACFAESTKPIQEYLDLLETYKFVSYPSMWSPYPVEDSTFQGIFWVSTRFFMCKRSSIDLTELMKCQLDYDYWKEAYPRARLCHWLEHLLHDTSPNCVYYPPIDFERIIIFTWANYHKYTLQRLNHQTFQEVKEWVYTKHYHYPCDLTN